MKTYRKRPSLYLLPVVAVASLLVPQWAQAQFGNAEQVAQQLALDKTYPEMQITDQYLHLAVPGQTMGQTTGVALNSKGHMFVYSRTNPQGMARGATAAMLFEFDQNYKFVREWGDHNYAEAFAHAVKVDKDDNVWIVDEGSGMVVKFISPDVSTYWLGRTPEAIDYLQGYLEHFGRAYTEEANREAHPKGRVGSFDRPTDVAWDSEGDTFVTDGYGNSRIVKIAPDGKWLKEVGTYGSGQDQFNTPHGVAVDAKNNVYVADRGNRRIQVYDSNLNFEKSITGAGSPWAVCVSPGAAQYLYSGDGTTGKVYKMSLDGKVLGIAQTSLGHGEAADLIHAMACPSANTVYLGSASMWDVQKISIHPGSGQAGER